MGIKKVPVEGKPKKRLAKVIEELQKGPATTEDIATELGLGTRLACAHLSKLRSAGVVRVQERKIDDGRGGRPQNIWELCE